MDSESEFTKLYFEVKAIRKKMLVLPTIRESEALSDLVSVKEILTVFIGDHRLSIEDQFVKNPNLEKLIMCDLIEGVCGDILRAKIYSNKEIVKIADDIFQKTVTFCTRRLGHEKSIDFRILSLILDKNNDYYKNNGSSCNFHEFAFGDQMNPSDEMKTWLNSLKKGDLIDGLKSNGSSRFWSRGVVESTDGFSKRVRFFGDLTTSLITCPEYDIAPLNTRAVDFEWRESLEVGDLIDYCSQFSKWKLYKIDEISTETNMFKESIKLIVISKVTEESSNKEGKKKHFGQTDLAVDFFNKGKRSINTKAHSPMIAKPYSYSKNKVMLINDSEDVSLLRMTTERKCAILRPQLINSGCASCYFIKYANLFGKYNGMDFIFDVVEGKRKINPETEMFVSQILQNLSEVIVSPLIQEKGKSILNWLSISMGDSIEKNIRLYTSIHLANFIGTVSGINQRIFSKKEAEKLNCEIIIQIGIVCLKSDILEKQFFGAKKIIEIEEKLNDLEQTDIKGKLAQSLIENNIFEKIIKGHPNFIEKSTGVLKVLFHADAISPNEIDALWEQIRKADSESKMALISMLKNISSDLSFQSFKHLVEKMSSSLPEPTPDLIDLISTLRRVATQYNENELGRLLYELVWKIYQESETLKPELMKELINMLFKINDMDVLTTYLNKAVDNLLGGHHKSRNLKLLIKIFEDVKFQTKRILEICRENSLVDFLIDELGSLYSKQKNDSTSESGLTKLSKEDSSNEGLKVNRIVEFFKAVHLYSVNNFYENFIEFANLTRIFQLMLDLDIKDNSIGEWIRNLIKESINEKNVTLFQNLFSKNIGYLANCPNESNFTTFIVLFMGINQTLGKIVNRKVKLINPMNPHKSTFQIVHTNLKPFSDMFGSDSLWEALILCENKSIYSQIANIIANFHLASEYADKFDETEYETQRQQLLKQSYDLVLSENPVHSQKGCILLMKLIKNEETLKSSGLMSFDQLREGDRISLILEKVQHYLKERSKVLIYEYSTVFQLKELVANEYRVPFDSVEIENEKGQKLMKQDHILTLDNVGVFNCDVLNVSEKDIPDQVIELVTKDNSDFTDYLKRILFEVFEANSLDGKMSLSEFGKVLEKMSMTTLSNDEKMKVFSKITIEDSNWIDFDGFLNYMKLKTLKSNSPTSLKQTLTQLGYSSPIRPKRFEIENNPDKIKQFIRYRLSNDDIFMTKLCSLIGDRIIVKQNDDEKDHDYVIRLFMLLSPKTTDLSLALEHPIEFLSTSKTPIDLIMRPSILSSLLFKEDLPKSLITRKLNSNVEAINQLKSTAVTIGFSKTLVGFTGCFVNESLRTSSQFDYRFFSILRLLERILKLFVNQKDEVFFDSVKTIMGYFNKKKTKIMSNDKPTSIEDKKNVRGNSDSKGTSNAKQREEFDLEDMFILRFSHLMPDLLCDNVESDLGFQNLSVHLLSLMQAYVGENAKNTKEDRSYLKTLSMVFIYSVKLNASEVESMVTNPLFEEVMIKGLSHKGSFCRMYFKNIYAVVCFETESIKVKTSLLKIIIKALAIKDLEELQGMIELAGMILADIGEAKSKNPEIEKYLHQEMNFMELFVKFRDLLLNHKSTELNFDETDDVLMRSYFTFLEKIIRTEESILHQISLKEKEDLVTFIFKNCLFEINSSGVSFNNLFCKNKRSRATAFDLLKQLLRNDFNLSSFFIKSCLHPMSEHLPVFSTQTQFNQDVERRIRFGFTGIHNLGCVCYMLATLQQFYCIPIFRYGVLMANDNVPEEIVEYKNRKIDDNMFHQFQKMMAHLDFSERKDFNPLEFCYAYKDPSGEPTNIAIQMDADEFVKVLLDRLESKLKGSPYIGVLNSVFLGEIVNLITCKNCSAVTVRNENFYNISLEVKGLSNIEDSFMKLIEPEIISDYQCDSCKKKCDISKQTKLKKLPNVLILSLKKMYFDLELLSNVKLHSKYEFPFSINLEKYCHQDVAVKRSDDVDDTDEGDKSNDVPSVSQPENYEYKLTGVVIHKGNAEFGHYTSIINTCRRDPARTDIPDGKWMEFDDSRVTPFDMTKFQEECYGGSEDKEFGFTSYSPESAMSKSAYLLFYEKVVKDKIVFPFNSQNLSEKDKIIRTLIEKNDYLFQEDRLITSFNNLGPFCPEPYLSHIQNDNRLLTMEQCVQSKTFTNGIAKIVEELDLKMPEQNSKIEVFQTKRELAELLLKTLPKLLLRVYSTAYENFQIDKINEGIKKSLELIINYAHLYPESKLKIEEELGVYFRENIFKKFEEIITTILHTNDMTLRKSLVEYFCDSISILMRFYQIGNLKENIHENSPKSNFKIQVSECLQIFLNNILKIDSWNSQNRMFGLMFGIMKRLADQNESVVLYMAEADMLPFLFRIYTSSNSSTSIGIEKILIRILGLIRLLYSFEVKNSPFNSSFRDHLDGICKYELLGQCIHEDNKDDGFNEMRQIIQAMCTEDKTTSELIIMYCLKNFYNRVEVEIMGQLISLHTLLLINDSLTLYRTKLVLGIPKLREQINKNKDNKNWPYFGLGKDTSLTSIVVNYVSPFNCEKSLLEWAWSCHQTKPNFVIPMIYFIMDASVKSDVVFDYLVRLDSPTYLGATSYDWMDQYMENHLSYFDNNPINLRSDFESLFGSLVKSTIDKFKSKIAERHAKLFSNQKDTKFFSNDSKDFLSSSFNSTHKSNDNDSKLLAVWKPIYLIGATKEYKRVGRLVIADEENEKISFTASIIKVPMIESLPTGHTNLSIPSYSITSTFNILPSSFQSDNPALYNCFNIVHSKTSPNISQSSIDSDSVSDESDNNEKKENKTETDQTQSSVSQTGSILLITIKHMTENSNFFKLKIVNQNALEFNRENLLMIPMKTAVARHLAASVVGNGPTDDLSGLRVSVCWKSWESVNMNDYSDDGFSNWHVLFGHK